MLEAIDARLKDAVLQALRRDPRVNEAEIGVAVEHRVVTLTGRVDSDAERAAAQEAAHQTAGVLDVANEIHVRIPFALGRCDTDLAGDVRRALECRLGPSARLVHSTVYDACVTLEGSVDMVREREDAERAVHRLCGVRRIDNRIVVRGSAAGS
jgi:osmotically-inducible protein OsmY